VAKPDPEIYRRLLDRNGLEPAGCLFIDDVAANVAAARALGMVAHHFTGAEALGQELRERGLL
jgi:2-haloacid dehalogenase